MKKLIVFILGLAMAFSMTACGHEHEFGEWSTITEATCTEEGLRERYCECEEKETEAIPLAEHTYGEWTVVTAATFTEEGMKECECECGAKITEAIPVVESVYATDEFCVNGIYIDESHEDEDFNLVYLFYTLTAVSRNLEANQVLIDICLNNTNVYTPTMSVNYIPRYTDYYYSSYNEDVYVGTSLNVCQTYQIPKGEFVADHTISLESSYVDVSSILLSTDEVEYMNGMVEIAKSLNEDVFNVKYQKELEMFSEVDPVVENAIKAGLNDKYYWLFEANSFDEKLEFFSPNTFKITILDHNLSNTGTYTVKAGCIVLYYPSNNHEVVIPFIRNDDGTPAFSENGSLRMSLTAAFEAIYVDYDGRE